MTVHRRLTTDDKDISTEVTNDDDNNNDVPTQLDRNQHMITTTSLEIGDASTASSSCDVIMEADRDDEDIDALVDDLQRDAESLLSRPLSNTHGSTCCELPYKVGNCTVLLPSLYVRTGLGIVGPHWCGLITTFLLVFSGSFYFLQKALLAGPITFTLTLTLTLVCTLALTRTGLADPGIITIGNPNTQCPIATTAPAIIAKPLSSTRKQQKNLKDNKWCDICNVIQPSHAVHCPECNLCIEHYDHHCPWMGTCVGKNNFRAFVIFNCAWITYLIFGLSWIASLAAQEVN